MDAEENQEILSLCQAKTEDFLSSFTYCGLSAG